MLHVRERSKGDFLVESSYRIHHGFFPFFFFSFISFFCISLFLLSFFCFIISTPFISLPQNFPRKIFSIGVTDVVSPCLVFLGIKQPFDRSYRSCQSVRNISRVSTLSTHRTNCIPSLSIFFLLFPFHFRVVREQREKCYRLPDS